MISRVLLQVYIKWRHHSGNAFGVAVSGTVYTVLAANLNLNLGGFTGMMFNALLAIVAFLVILLLVPKNQTNL